MELGYVITYLLRPYHRHSHIWTRVCHYIFPSSIPSTQAHLNSGMSLHFSIVRTITTGACKMEETLDSWVITNRNYQHLLFVLLFFHLKDDGLTWIGPSANQLKRALDRKGKGASTTPEEIKVVSAIHSVVTEMTWQKLLEYEQLHFRYDFNWH